MIKFWILVSTAVLSACGGAGPPGPVAGANPQIRVQVAPDQSAAYAYKVVVRLAQDQPVPGYRDFNGSVVTPAAALSPAESVAFQATAPMHVAVTIGSAKSTDYSNLPQFLSAAANYPNVKGVYLYDELFLDRHGNIAMGQDEQAVIAAADTVTQAGYASMVTITPRVVLDPAFALQQPNAFSVIGLNLYPSDNHMWPPACSYNENLYTTILYCAVQKLRGMGYTGQIWYVYQAFGRTDDPNQQRQLLEQQATIAQAPKLGITGLVAFGGFDPTHTNLLAPLYPGAGSVIQELVSCSWGC